MHDGTEREIRIEAELEKRDLRRLGWRRLGLAEIGSRRAEEGGMNLVKCDKGRKMPK
jgi:hypothetical protein